MIIPKYDFITLKNGGFYYTEKGTILQNNSEKKLEATKFYRVHHDYHKIQNMQQLFLDIAEKGRISSDQMTEYWLNIPTVAIWDT